MASSMSLLVADVYRGHWDQFRDALSSISTDVALIPSGCSCRLQPLDVCVTPVLRDFLQVLRHVSVTSLTFYILSNILIIIHSLL